METVGSPAPSTEYFDAVCNWMHILPPASSLQPTSTTICVARKGVAPRMKPSEGRKRIIIEEIQPTVNDGRYPAKRILGDHVEVTAAIFGDGHDHVAARLLYRHASQRKWSSVPFAEINNDRWTATFPAGSPDDPSKLGLWYFTIEAWIDHFDTWVHDLDKRLAAQDDCRAGHPSRSPHRRHALRRRRLARQRKRRKKTSSRRHPSPHPRRRQPPSLRLAHHPNPHRPRRQVSRLQLRYQARTRAPSLDRSRARPLLLLVRTLPPQRRPSRPTRHSPRRSNTRP